MPTKFGGQWYVCTKAGRLEGARQASLARKEWGSAWTEGWRGVLKGSAEPQRVLEQERGSMSSVP